MVDPELISEALALLNRARLIAEAPAAGAVQIGHTHPQGHLPPGLRFTSQGSLGAAHRSTLVVFGERINRAIGHDSDPELRSAIKWCRSELESLQHSPGAGAESPAEFHHRICRDYEGVLAGVVARQEMTSVTTVRKWRSADGRDARLGHKLTGEGER